MFKALKASIKLLLFIFTTLFFLLPVALFRWHHNIHQASMRWYFKTCLAIFGVRVDYQNALQQTPAKALYISNHCSYLDIFVIGAYLPIKFTPKSDIASWPIVGSIVKLSGAIFIDRRASQVKKQQVMLEKSYAQGNQLMLFAEGTTSNGAELLPFKSSLFSVAHMVDDIQIVPALVNYRKLNGQTAQRSELDQLAWYADMTLGPHFWNLLNQSSANVSLRVFETLNPHDFVDRKALAAECEKVLREKF